MTDHPATRLWIRSFLFLLASTLWLWSSVCFLLPGLALYVTQQRGGTFSDVGLISTVPGVNAVAGPVCAGAARLRGPPNVGGRRSA
jgi:hypothetical protein